MGSGYDGYLGNLYESMMLDNQVKSPFNTR